MRGGTSRRLRLVAMTRSPMPRAFSASLRPMLPRPTMPSVWPSIRRSVGPACKGVAPALGGVVIQGHFAAERQKQRQGVLGDFDQAVVGHVGYRDAAARGVGHIDVVEPDPEAADDPATRGGFDHLRGDTNPVGENGVAVARAGQATVGPFSPRRRVRRLLRRGCDVRCRDRARRSR